MSNCQKFQTLEKSSQSCFFSSRKVRNDRFNLRDLNFKDFGYFFIFIFHFATFSIQLDNSSSRFQISSKSIPTLSVFLTHVFNPLSSLISALTISFSIVFPLQKFLLPSDFSGIFSGMPRGKHLIATQKDRIYSYVCKDHTVEHIFSLLL